MSQQPYGTYQPPPSNNGPYQPPQYQQPYPQPPQQQQYVAAVAVPVANDGFYVNSSLNGSQGRCCGCSNTCCNPYLNFSMMIMVLLALISCIVNFTSELHYLKLGTGSDLPYKNSFTIKSVVATINGDNAVTTNYNDIPDSSPFYSCKVASSALVGCSSVGLILLILSFSFSSIRIFNCFSGVSARLGGFSKVVIFECVTVPLSLIVVLIGSSLWYSKCFGPTIDFATSDAAKAQYSSYEVGSTGYSFLSTSVLLLIISCVHLTYIKANPYFASFGRNQEQVPPQNQYFLAPNQ